MKRSTQKILGMAASGVLLLRERSFRPHPGNTYTWQTTGIGNSQDWSTAANWTPTVVPGFGDVAFFSTNRPPSDTISVNSPVSVGSVLDELTSTLSIGGGSLMTLFEPDPGRSAVGRDNELQQCCPCDREC